MLRIDVYQRGAGYRVRVHHHMLSEDEGRCHDGCYEYACERAYPQRGDSPRQERAAVEAALAAALRSIGHREFIGLLVDSETLNLPR